MKEKLKEEIIKIINESKCKSHFSKFPIPCSSNRIDFLCAGRSAIRIYLNTYGYSNGIATIDWSAFVDASEAFAKKFADLLNDAVQLVNTINEFADEWYLNNSENNNYKI